MRVIHQTFMLLTFAWCITLLNTLPKAIGADLANSELAPPVAAASTLADLSHIANDVEKLDAVFDLALELTKMGAGYEGARLIASIAVTTTDPSIRFNALDYLEEWDLSPEEVLHGNVHIVHQKVIASAQHQLLPGNAFGHVRNLIKLNLLQEATDLLERDCMALARRPFENKWGMLLDEFEIPVESFYEGNRDQRLELIVQAFNHQHLKDQLPLIWFKNHEAWKNANDLLHYDHFKREKNLPLEVGLKGKVLRVCIIACSVALLLCMVLLLTGVRRSKWKMYVFATASLLLFSSASIIYYIKYIYINPKIRPYARWVDNRKRWTDDDLPSLPPQRELIETAFQHAKEFADQGEWRATKLLLDVLIFSQNPNADLTREKSLLAEAMDRLALRKNHFLSDQRPGRDEADDLFESDKVHRYQLELGNEAIQALRDDPKIYVRGTFKHGDKTYPDVGVKLKGGWGSFRIIQGDSKPAFSIKFDAFSKDQRFYGLKRIILNNAVQDPSYLHEAVGYSFFRDSGVVAPRVCHATLRVNDETYGLYVQVEAATKDYLKRWFEDPSGDLFEGPGGVIDWEDLDLDSNQESGDRTRIRMLYEAIMEADPIDPWSTLKNWIDLKAFARFMANEQFINNWDGYPEANNYRLYDDPTTGKFYFFPHGADQSMEDSRHDMFGTNLEEVVGRALVMTQTGRQAYREAIQGFLDHAWDSEKRLERIRSWYVRIYPHITSGLAPFDENLFEQNVTQIIKFVKMRPFVVRHQLNVDALSADWKHYDEVLPFFEPYSEQ
jgi:hypothetical protein